VATIGALHMQIKVLQANILGKSSSHLHAKCRRIIDLQGFDGTTIGREK
jgi:hypothetical protein